LQICKDLELQTKQHKQLIAKNYKVGMVLSRQAYKNLKTEGIYLQYEVDLAVLVEQGVDIGNLNHSRNFASEFGQ